MTHSKLSCSPRLGAACPQLTTSLKCWVCWQLAMLLLVEWNSAEHNAEGIAFAQHCRRTVKGMSKEGGI